MLHESSNKRFALQYAMAALITFTGSAVLLKGTAFPLGTPGPRLLILCVAYLMMLTGAFLVFLAGTVLIQARGPFHGPRDRTKNGRR